MKYLATLWQALMALFAHLHVKQQTQQTEAARDKLDEEVRDASQSDRDERLDKWYRD